MSRLFKLLPASSALSYLGTAAYEFLLDKSVRKMNHNEVLQFIQLHQTLAIYPNEKWN